MNVRDQRDDIWCEAGSCLYPMKSQTHRDLAMTDRSTRTVRFLRASLERPAPDRCQAVVEVAGAFGGIRSGAAEGGSAPLEMLRTVARAAADAVSAASDSPPTTVRVRGIQQVEAFGQLVIIVSLAATRAGKSHTLLGVSEGGDDLPRGAALAVLNATNRFLGVG
jgi:hypothetical protein